MLTAYNDNPIYYDEIGNPTLYYNNAAMTWVDGRRLSEICFDDYGDMLFFDYDSDGMRLSKYGPRVYDYNYAFANTPLFYVDYYYDGDTLIYERRSYNGDNQSTLFTIEYLYGVNGITGFRIHQGNTTTDYFYVKNIMGDVLGIVDSSGTLVAEYRYDAYGNPVMILDGNGNDVSNNYAHIANINPIRYRGYYYDVETGFYYLNSRYYDPEIGRFINADGMISGTGESVQGYNLFAYCFNNPVNMSDTDGNWPRWIKDAADYVNENVIKPITTFASKVSKAFSADGAGEKIKDIVLNNISASAGVSMGFSFQETYANSIGIDFAQRMDIVSIEFREGKVDFGHSGKAALAFNIGPFSIGPKSEVFESSISGERRVYDDVNFDIGFSYGSSKAFFIGYQYNISISYLGIFTDVIEYINTF